MARYRSAPSFAHDRPTRLGVLLINLGTPDAPTTAAVRRYLAQFLSDPRVVEIPRALWAPLLHGVILNSRPAKSAQKYATIWTKEGSPLLVHSLRQKTLLQGYLGQRLKDLGLPSDLAQVALGMRYGQPSIESALAKLEAVARDRGSAVGVASSLPVSIERIFQWSKSTESRGITLVPISVVANRPKV